MKVLAINGSYRKGKTIDTLIDKAIQGVKLVDSSIELEKIYLKDKNIQYCTNCMTCYDNNPDKPYARCVIQDDMQEIYPKMIEADGYILGSPINCGTETAVMKAFLERIVWVLSKPGNKPLKGCPKPRTNKKKAAMFIVSSGIVPPALRWFCDDASRHFNSTLKACFDTKIVSNIYAGAVRNRGVSCYFDKAVNGGTKLAKELLRSA